MRFFRTSVVLILSCGVVPAFSQNTTSSTTSSGATTTKGPVDLTGFREHIEEKNKTLTDQVTTTKAIVKKNTAILQDAKRIDADNKRLAAERKELDAQNAEFARESQAMQSEATGVSVSTPPPAAPVRVEPVAPARVEPPPPGPVETAVAPRAESIPARPAPVVAPEPAASQPQVLDNRIVNNTDASLVRVADPVAVAANSPVARPVAADALQPSVSVADPGPVRVSSGVSQGMLLTPIVPVYPSIAVSAHVEGAVVMEAIISREGNISSLHAISGPMMLRTAALDAVRVARYRPYSVNGERTEVAATIKVVFQLSR